MASFDISYYVEKTKFLLTGGVLESELKDKDYKKIINLALQEVNRYYDSTMLIQVPGSSCIDLAEVENKNNIKINYIAAIYRTKPNGTSSATSGADPMLISQWNLANNYYNYGSTRWAYNYLAYNTVNQISNTLSTDLDFKEDKLGKKLYVNFTNGVDDDLTLEYVPTLEKVEEIQGDYWVDILSKLSLAYAKITLGRIRTRYTQSDALWSQDGETLLTEGKEELKDLQDRLRTKVNFMYPLD